VRVALRLGTTAGVPARIDWLSAQEQSRLQAIGRASRRAQFVAGRWLLRCLLAAECGGRADQWSLDDQGPPRLITGPSRFDGVLGLAHSGDDVIAACAAGPFGVDLERTSRAPPDPRAWRDFVLTPPERAATEHVQAEVLLCHWAAKEAFGKAGGEGLPFEQMQRIEAHPAVPGEDGNTLMLVSRQFVIAVCTPGSVPSLHWHGGEPSGFEGSRWQVRAR
jgi:4'-phosphopantetheinyl transferase